MGLVVVYLVTYVGSVVALFSPFYGLLAYVCFAVIRPASLWHWSVPQDGNFSRLLGIAMLVGWAFHGFGKWRWGRAQVIVCALLAYLAWASVSASLAPDQSEAWHFVEELSKVVLPVLVGMTTIDSMHKVRQLVWVIVLSLGYVAFELNISYFSGFNRLHMTGFGGMDNNSFAIALVTGCGFAFFLGLEERVWWRKWLAFAATALMAHAVFFSFSRGGMLALLITGVVVFLLLDRKPKHHAWLALAVVVALRMAGPEVRERFASAFLNSEQRDVSATSRLDLWRDCWDAMLKNPMLGVGPDHWPLIAHTYGWPKGKEAHSLWFQTGAELGFIGVGLLAAYYLLAIWRLWPYARRRLTPSDSWLATLARMVIASLAGFMVAGQFVSLEGLELPYYVVLCGMAGLAVESRGPWAVSDESPIVESPYLWGAVSR
jgi:probable O-glycosylation ligase (exosortase A-associated)